MCGGHFLHEAEHFVAPAAELATSIFAPELAPILDPIEGALGGALNGGGLKGAAIGGLEGAVGGQLTGTGEYAPLSTAATGPADMFGVATGGTSALGQAENYIGSQLGAVGSSVGSALGLGSDNAGTYGTTTPTGAGIAAPTGAPTTGGATGGPSGISAPSPSSVAPSTGDVSLDSLDPKNFSSLNGGGTSLDSVASQNLPGSATTNTGNVGAGSTGTPTVPSSSVGQLYNGTSVPGETGNAGTYGQPTTPMSAMGGGTPGATGAADNFASSVMGGSTPATVAGGASPPGSFLNQLETGALNSVKQNALPMGISAIGLGVDAMKEGQMLKGQRQLQQEAGQMQGQGAQLESYLQSGTLPPGLQAGVDQATQASIASIKSNYAAKGMSGSSAEAQDIAAAQQRAQATGAQYAMQLLQTGINETNMSSELYKAIMGNSLTQDTNLSSAIGNFASAAAGGQKPKVMQE